MLADFQTKANKRWDDYTNGRFWESEEI